jgi:hypothetical protein
MPERKQPETERVSVTNNLETVLDTARAADLFARIVRAVREQRAEDEEKRKNGFKPAA